MRSKNVPLILALSGAAVLLSGCADTSEQDAGATAVAYFKATPLEQCQMAADMSDAEVSECEADRADWTNTPFSEGDYAVQPEAVRTQERGNGGYAVLVEATTSDQKVNSTVYALVQDGEDWKVADEKLVDGRVAEDLCYHLGGECK